MNEEWMTDERILSVSDMAVAYEVNPNTVMHACDILLKVKSYLSAEA